MFYPNKTNKIQVLYSFALVCKKGSLHSLCEINFLEYAVQTNNWTCSAHWSECRSFSFLCDDQSFLFGSFTEMTCSNAMELLVVKLPQRS